LRKRQEAERGRDPCRCEALESRTHLSADLFDSSPSNVLNLSAPRAAVPAYSASVGPMVATVNRYPQVVGTWVGTCKTAGKRGRVEVAVRITAQVRGGATGKFALGPVTTWHKVLSTAGLTATLDRSFRVILPGADFYGSVTATVSENARQIVGRWTCNNNGNWKSGTIVLNRQ
jgi:hypothetical protein